MAPASLARRRQWACHPKVRVGDKLPPQTRLAPPSEALPPRQASLGPKNRHKLEHRLRGWPCKGGRTADSRRPGPSAAGRPAPQPGAPAVPAAPYIGAMSALRGMAGMWPSCRREPGPHSLLCPHPPSRPRLPPCSVQTAVTIQWGPGTEGLGTLKVKHLLRGGRALSSTLT